MFTGHHAPAFALHRRFPQVPLWKLFVAVQGLDLLFWPMAAAGLERMHVDATAAGPLALVLEFMPYSHSLAAAGLLAVQAVQTFLVPLPTSVPLLAAMSVGSYVGFAGVAWWIGR